MQPDPLPQYGDVMTAETPMTSAGLPTAAHSAASTPPPLDPTPWTRCLTLREIEAAGAELMPRGPRAYYEGAAADEVTLRDNQMAFERWRIVPRMMVHNNQRDASVEVLGRRWPMPVAIAPMALQRLAHPDGEVAVARATAARGLTYILSTCASAGFEELAETGSPRWFQLYLLSDRARSKELIDLAEATGHEAIVLDIRDRGAEGSECASWGIDPGYIPLLGYGSAVLEDGSFNYVRGGFDGFGTPANITGILPDTNVARLLLLDLGGGDRVGIWIETSRGGDATAQIADAMPVVESMHFAD